jgi:NAD(P)H-hydrate epimerase
MLEAISPATMQIIDRDAIDKKNIPSLVLMENAGRGVAHFIKQELSPKMVVVVAGKGNNGGDALVAARDLKLNGVELHVYCTHPPEECSRDLAHNLLVYQNFGGTVTFLESTQDLRTLEKSLLETEAVIDGI